MSFKKFALKDVRPNPYRDLKRFPVVPEKVEALKESYEATGYWENIEGREVDGLLELAYGHNRFAALKAMYKPSDEFNFIVRNMSDSDMIQRMSRENNEAYRADVGGTIESVRAAVLALSEGKITRGNKPGQMPQVAEKTAYSYKKYAPSFLSGVSDSKLLSHPYTALSVAVYLGCAENTGKGKVQSNPNIIAAFILLELEECKVPGWTSADSSELDKLRNADGAIPAARAIKIGKEARDRWNEMREREATKAEVVKQAGMTAKQIDAQNKAIKAEQKAAQIILDAEQAAADKAAIEEEAAFRAAKKIQDEKDKKEREARRKEAELLFELERKAIAESAEALALVEQERLKREEAQRASFASTQRQSTRRILSKEDPLFENLKRIGHDPKTTEKERLQQIEALDDVIGRVEQAKKLMYPEPAQKKEKK